MADADPQPRDLPRTFLMVLATVWVFDAVLQIQPMMFTPGPDGFSGVLSRVANGGPGWIAHTITWNASMVDHHPVLANTPFAVVECLIGFGIVWTRTRKAALALSIVWSLGVWWFGEGLGGIFSGLATPFGEVPGACSSMLSSLFCCGRVHARTSHSWPPTRSECGRRSHLGRSMDHAGCVVSGRGGSLATGTV